MLSKASSQEISLYVESLKKVAALSNLYSDSDVAYLNYRSAEKIYCRSFNFQDVSRSDIAIDAHNFNVGVGIKTFLGKSGTNNYQKIAEFNKDYSSFEKLNIKDKVLLVSELRNERLKLTENLYGLKSFIYHCILRKIDVFEIHEIEMDYIDLSNISIIKETDKSVFFEDGKFEYSFSFSKSTLFKNFKLSKPEIVFDVNILEDPESFFDFPSSSLAENIKFKKTNESIVLPLFGKNKTVYPKSGLNAWNASGRKRDLDEVYIPVPASVRSSAKSNFFENKNFDLILPNNKVINCKICQDDGKALMSNPNKDLGKWILRDVLNLAKGEILTYKKLQKIGIDSVRFEKINSDVYKLDFVSFEDDED